jgi:hypothetical protein
MESQDYVIRVRKSLSLSPAWKARCHCIVLTTTSKVNGRNQGRELPRKSQRLSCFCATSTPLFKCPLFFLPFSYNLQIMVCCLYRSAEFTHGLIISPRVCRSHRLANYLRSKQNNPTPENMTTENFRSAPFIQARDRTERDM